MHIPLCVVGNGDVIYSIVTVVRTVHTQLRMILTKTVVGFVKEVVLVWIQLQCDTVLPMSSDSLCPVTSGPVQSYFWPLLVHKNLFPLGQPTSVVLVSLR